MDFSSPIGGGGGEEGGLTFANSYITLEVHLTAVRKAEHGVDGCLS